MADSQASNSQLSTDTLLLADSQDSSGLVSSTDSYTPQLVTSLTSSTNSFTNNQTISPLSLSDTITTNKPTLIASTTPQKKQKKDDPSNQNKKRQRTGYSPKLVPRNENEGELWKLKLPELRDILKAANLSSTGNKDVLVARIMQQAENDPMKLKSMLMAANISTSNISSTPAILSKSQEISAASIPLSMNAHSVIINNDIPTSLEIPKLPLESSVTNIISLSNPVTDHHKQ